MPELPEVETVCRIMRRVLVGERIAEIEVPPDPIVLSGYTPDQIVAAVKGREVSAIGRKGKFWWISFKPTSGKPGALCGHLGMAGWIRELGEPTARLREHGSKPLDDETGRPRFLKLLLTVGGGRRIAFTDGRRLGRLWLAEDPQTDSRVKKLGPDALNELPSSKDLQFAFAKRPGPIKGVLLDQTFISGIGNYLADEILYRSLISPKRQAKSLKSKEISAMREAIVSVLQAAIDVGADSEKFPADWLFHLRWDGKRGANEIAGRKLVRETVAGRTTAWVPGLQK